jgi:AraC-like DNA-binding protein
LREALGDPEIRIGRKSTAIAVPRQLLAQPLRGSGRALGENAELYEKRLRQTAPATNFPDALRQLARSLMKEGSPPRVETMAEITGLSVRSLQRRLAKHGATHHQIVDQARYETATRLLADADNRITDIGMDLGYTDSAHFSRAFKRWAGVTPSKYRGHQLMRCRPAVLLRAACSGHPSQRRSPPAGAPRYRRSM